jgi:hypothetical protein
LGEKRSDVLYKTMKIKKRDKEQEHTHNISENALKVFRN